MKQENWVHIPACLSIMCDFSNSLDPMYETIYKTKDIKLLEKKIQMKKPLRKCISPQNQQIWTTL